MKKLLMGAVSLFLFAISIAVVEMSCQKTIAQTNTGIVSGHFMLYHTTKYVPVEYTLQKDDTASHNQTYIAQQPINTYYMSDISGANERIIPVSIPDGMYSGEYAKLTDDGMVLVFSLYKAIAPTIGQNGPTATYYIYTCNVDGSNLKQVKEAYSLDDVH